MGAAPPATVDGQTVFLRLERTGREHPHRIALSDDRRSWTYQELCDEAETIASGLVQLAGGPRGSFAVVSENRSEVYSCWLAGSRSGLMPSVVNPQLTPAELAKPLRRLQPALVATPSSHHERVLAALQLADLDTPIVAFEDDSGVPRGSVPYQDLLAGDRYRGGHPDGADVFEVAWTSGTTSEPKGVMLSHSGVVSHWSAVQRSLGLDSTDVAYVVTPLYHQSGLRHTTMVIWMAGGRAHLASRFSSKIFWDDVERVGATYACLVPTMRHILRTATPGGFEAHPALLGPTACYGSTETGVPVLVPRAMPAEELAPYLDGVPGASFAGWPTPGCAAKIEGEDDGTPEEGAEGQLLVRFPGMLQGYWADPAASAAAFTDGWFRSGDLFRRGPDGSLYFLDRLRDLVRRGGENIASREIEEALETHPRVAQAAIVAVPDAVYGEEAKAVVVTVDGDPIDPVELWETCTQRLAPFKVPRYIEFREVMPVSASGKVRKVELREAGVDPARTHDRAAFVEGLEA